MTIDLRAATPADIAAIGTLAHHIWNLHYPGIISQAQIDYMLALMYGPEALTRQFEEGHRFLLAEQRKTLLGFLSTEAKPDHYFIHKFYVAPQRHGQGIGGALLAHFLEQTPQASLLKLHVNRNNHKAVRFYRKHRFTVCGEKDTVIGQGYVMDDYVMQRVID